MQDDTQVCRTRKGPDQPDALTAIDYLAEAIAHRLHRRDFAAQLLELKAWETNTCTDFIFGEYHLHLAIRLAREGRFGEAHRAQMRADSLMGRDPRGRRAYNLGRSQMRAWLIAGNEDPALIMAEAVPSY